MDKRKVFNEHIPAYGWIHFIYDLYYWMCTEYRACVYPSVYKYKKIEELYE